MFLVNFSIFSLVYNFFFDSFVVLILNIKQMKGLYDEIFNKASIYDMLFFSVKAVLIHPTLECLKAENEPMYDRWKYVSKTKYDCDLDVDSSTSKSGQKVYEDYAVYYPEYCKIVAITYASIYLEDGNIKRNFKKIINMDERVLLETFMTELTYLSSAATQVTPYFFPTLCGHNIFGHDIPFLIKRFVLLHTQFETPMQLPLIIKRTLNSKPWETDVIDTSIVWKFNGYDNISLMMISDFLGLKRTVDIMPHNELSKYYWDNIEVNQKETLEYIGLQAANQTNLVIKLINELRVL